MQRPSGMKELGQLGTGRVTIGKDEGALESCVGPGEGPFLVCTGLMDPFPGKL